MIGKPSTSVGGFFGGLGERFFLFLILALGSREGKAGPDHDSFSVSS